MFPRLRGRLAIAELDLNSQPCRGGLHQAILRAGLMVVMMQIGMGCEGRGFHGLSRPRSLSVADDPEGSGQSSLPLVPSEARSHLGQVLPGGQKSLAFALTNRSTAPVEVVALETSCDCVKVSLPDRTLAPGQKVRGRIDLDLRDDPHFKGRLRIRVSGKEKSGETVFAMDVDVVVKKD